MHPFFRLLPYIFAVVGTVLATTFIWLAPSTETSSGTFEARGDARQAVVTCHAGSTRSFQWDTVLEGPTESMTPILPYSVRASSGEASGVCEALLFIRVYADGKQVFAATHGFILEHENEGTYRSGSAGVPDSHSELEGWPDKDRIEVRISAQLTLRVTEPGTGRFEAEVGPLTVHHAPLDLDRDGVEDRSQLAPFHSGLATLLVAVVLIGLAVLSSKWWTRRAEP